MEIPGRGRYPDGPVVSFMFYELLSSWSRLRAIHPHTNLDFDVDGFAR